MSSTEYIDKKLLDEKGLIIRESLDSIKNYCGLFAFVYGICRDDDLDDDQKIKLINNVIKVTLDVTRKKYKLNLKIYNQQAFENLEPGKAFTSLVDTPAKMQEAYEAGMKEVKTYLYMEIYDIMTVLGIELDLGEESYE